MLLLMSGMGHPWGFGAVERCEAAFGGLERWLSDYEH